MQQSWSDAKDQRRHINMQENWHEVDLGKEHELVWRNSNDNNNNYNFNNYNYNNCAGVKQYANSSLQTSSC